MLRKRTHRLPAALAARRPEVETGLGVRHAEASRLDSAFECRPTGAVALALLSDVSVVAEGCHERGLHRGGHQQPDVLARLGDRRDRAGVPDRETGAVAGEVAALGQRVQGQYAIGRAAADRRVQDRDRLGVPTELQVALVAGHQHVVLAAPRDDGGEPGRIEHRTGRVARGVQPHQADVRRVVRRRVVGRHRHAAGEAGPDVIGRVGQPRKQHLATRRQAEQRGEQRDQLLAADARDDVGGRDLDAEPLA